MKKVAPAFFSFLIVLTLLLGSFSTARAAAGDDPFVTPVSGDKEFTTEIVPIAALPGSTQTAGQMIVPVGFPEGEAQFGGNGIRVLGMDSGKATVCFSLDTVAVQQGWGGFVGVWNGSKWVKLATSITTTSDEAAATTACATITGNGTYAFIKYVTEPAKLPSYGQCGFEVMAFPIEGGELPFLPFKSTIALPSYDIEMEVAIVMTSNGYVLPVGGTVSYKIISTIPAGLILAGGSGSGIVAMNNGGDEMPIGLMIVVFDPPVLIDWDNSLEEDFEDLTVRIFFPDCYADFNFSGFFFPPIDV
jgi:hypothetical protein